MALWGPSTSSPHTSAYFTIQRPRSCSQSTLIQPTRVLVKPGSSKVLALTVGRSSTSRVSPTIWRSCGQLKIQTVDGSTNFLTTSTHRLRLRSVSETPFASRTMLNPIKRWCSDMQISGTEAHGAATTSHLIVPNRKKRLYAIKRRQWKAGCCF